MRVALFVTCLVDQVWPAAGAATVALLRHVGCEVAFDARQTCCGQPGFNAGHRGDARRLAERWIEIFEQSDAEAIVAPSGSCVAMVHHFGELFADAPDWQRRAHRLAERTHELSAFLVNVLGVSDVGASYQGRLAWHDACHALRDLGQRHEPRTLLRDVRGLELVELDDASSCCGFGGTFSVKYPDVSVAIADRKIEAIERAAVDGVVSGDTGCLMHLAGRLSRRGSAIKVLHLAEVLGRTG